MIDRAIEELVQEALSALPDAEGGIAIVLATSGEPPAMALLSTGDVYFDGTHVSVGIHASSSAVDRLGHAFTVLIPLGDTAARIEAIDAHAERVPPLAKITGEVTSIRPTAEPPWTLDMRFKPNPADHPAIPDHLGYWRSVRAWLEGELDTAPDLPMN